MRVAALDSSEILEFYERGLLRPGRGTIWLGAQRYDYNDTDDEVELAAGDLIGGEYFPPIPV